MKKINTASTARFLLNQEVVIENFSEKQERLLDVVPLIEKLEKSLKSMGYIINTAQYHDVIPGMITVTSAKDVGILNSIDIAATPNEDFHNISHGLGIRSLFDSI